MDDESTGVQICKIDPNTLEVINEFRFNTQTYGHLVCGLDGTMFINHTNKLIVLQEN